MTPRPVWMTNLRDVIPGIVFKGTTDYQLPRRYGNGCLRKPNYPIPNDRFVLSYLKRMGMGKLGLEAQILEETEMFVKHLEEEGVVDPSTTLAKFTSNIIMRMMFGQRWQYGDSLAANKIFADAIHSLHTESALLMLGDLVPLFRYLPNVARAKKEVNEALGYLRNFFRQTIEKHIAERDLVENDDFVNAYLQSHEKMDEEGMSNLVDLCQDVFLAATDTTSTTLNFVIIHMLNNPLWQEELLHEITTAFRGGVPSMEDLEKLPKLEATIQETLRLNPLGPLIPRATVHATKVRDYVVPANCQVWVNVYHINYDPVVFPDPMSFCPQRWLRPDGTFRRKYSEPNILLINNLPYQVTLYLLFLLLGLVEECVWASPWQGKRFHAFGQEFQHILTSGWSLCWYFRL